MQFQRLDHVAHQTLVDLSSSSSPLVRSLSLSLSPPLPISSPLNIKPKPYSLALLAATAPSPHHAPNLTRSSHLIHSQMEKSIAHELYSEILQSSNVELGPIPITTNSKHLDLNESDDGDVWQEDGSPWNASIEELDKASDMDREWQRRRNHFHTIGYRDGVTSGKEASAQEGFNIGFKESVFVGLNWGLVRGVTSTLACLPEGLREKIVEREEKRNKLRKLHESVHSLSTADALKLFHADLSNKSVKSSDSAEPSSHTVDKSCDGSSPLENYNRELQSLIVDTAVKVHFEIDP